MPSSRSAWGSDRVDQPGSAKPVTQPDAVEEGAANRVVLETADIQGRQFAAERFDTGQAASCSTIPASTPIGATCLKRPRAPSSLAVNCSSQKAATQILRRRPRQPGPLAVSLRDLPRQSGQHELQRQADRPRRRPLLLADGEHLFGPVLPRLAHNPYGRSTIKVHIVGDGKHYLAEERPAYVAELSERHATTR